MASTIIILFYKEKTECQRDLAEKMAENIQNWGLQLLTD